MSRIIVEKNLNEAQSVLQQFIADSKNIDAIEKAGELLSKAFKNGLRNFKIEERKMLQMEVMPM